LYINRPENDYQGLFGYNSGGVILVNIQLENADITGKNYTGTLAGYNSHLIDSCHTASCQVNGNKYIGGLVGENRGTINCSSSKNTVSGHSYTGGIAGINNTINGSINYCFSSGNITADVSYAGGLAGDNSHGIIRKCYSTAEVNANQGGGGLIGHTYNAEIINSYSAGTVSGSIPVGGLIALNSGSIVSNSFWDTDSSGQSSSEGGTGKTTSEMKDTATYTHLSTIGLDAAWDFVNNPNDDTASADIWHISGTLNNGYPFLAWQYHTVTYTAGDHGSISGTSPQIVEHGRDGTVVEAIPDEGYYFVYWSDGNTDNPRTETHVTADTSVTANFAFAINTYTLTYMAGDHGSISGTSLQIVEHGSNGTVVEAIPDEGYHFVEWSDGNTDNPRTDTDVNEDITVTANYIKMSGTENDLISMIKIYPNPAGNMIHYELPDIQTEKMTISCLTGKIILEKTELQEKGIIDISSLENGIYIIRITTQQGHFTMQIIKNK